MTQQVASVQVIEQFFFSHEAFNMQRHIFFTTVIIVSAMFGAYQYLPLPPTTQPDLPDLPTVSLITCDLGVTLEITGGVSATALAYIFPAACFLKLTSSRDLRTTIPAYACVAFGALVMVLSLALALGKAWTPAGEARICV
jgi:sodium-coupled neutral amino acid transporter 11